MSGRSNSSRPARARSSDGSGAPHRSGYENAYWIGRRMSVTPSCAITDPSTSSTIECTIDCGWTSTSMRSAATSNSQRASITSSPLFISVAESMVIFGPIRHVGWRSASAAVTRARASAARCSRNGPPDAVRISRLTSAGCAAVQALVDRVVLAVDRQHRDAAPPRRRHHHRARHDEDFLVGERDRLARLDRREDGVERGRAGRGEQHDVGVGMRRDLDQALGPAARPRAPIATAGTSRTCSASRAGIAAGRERRRRAARRDARRRPPARSGRSIRSSRGWRCLSCQLAPASQLPAQLRSGPCRLSCSHATNRTKT